MLGGMAELGDESMEEHLEIINLIKAHHWDDVALVGGDFLKINHPFISDREITGLLSYTVMDA